MTSHVALPDSWPQCRSQQNCSQVNQSGHPKPLYAGSLFVVAYRGTSKRSRLCPLGNPKVPSVASASLGNILTAERAWVLEVLSIQIRCWFEPVWIALDQSYPK